VVIHRHASTKQLPILVEKQRILGGTAWKGSFRQSRQKYRVEAERPRLVDSTSPDAAVSAFLRLSAQESQALGENTPDFVQVDGAHTRKRAHLSEH
jgi:hypothetical protein